MIDKDFQFEMLTQETMQLPAAMIQREIMEIIIINFRIPRKPKQKTFPSESYSSLSHKTYHIVRELRSCSIWNPESSALTPAPHLEPIFYKPLDIQHQPANFSLHSLRQEQDPLLIALKEYSKPYSNGEVK